MEQADHLCRATVGPQDVAGIAQRHDYIHGTSPELTQGAPQRVDFFVDVRQDPD